MVAERRKVKVKNKILKKLTAVKLHRVNRFEAFLDF